ncbi:major facilitator superfamily domain-containing protein [Pilobolus umbonatus]|nr:major facilitator superfamily domain-containing protein [Pilobolus umbonatus]
MKFGLPSIFPAKEPPVEEVYDDQKVVEKDDASSGVQSEEFEHGVQSGMAANQVWTKNHLIIAYILIWVVQFVLTMSSGVVWALNPYVTSSFSKHSLTAATSIISGIMSGVLVLPYAKLINTWGRPQCFALMVFVLCIGLIMMAACDNVITYCAAQVFFRVGSTNLTFSITIFIADTSSLRNRAFMIAFAGSPWLATIWTSGPISESILATIGFRWGFGVWAIIIPIICSPLFGIFYYNLVKARKAGLIPKVESDRTFIQEIFHQCYEFDLIGILLLCAGLSLFMLPFSIYSFQEKKWESPLIISFFVVGAVLLISFTLWEKYGPTKPFIPWGLLTDRTVLFTYTMVASIYSSWYIWNGFFYSYLLVVYRLSITNSTYLNNIYTIGSCLWSLVMGVLIRYNGRLKWQALYFGVPMTALGVGLMINFRQPDVNIGFIVMCLIFIALGGGTLVICQQMTVMTVASHQYVSSVLSLENTVVYIFGGIGSAIATAMWTSIFPEKLAQNLPASVLPRLAEIVGDMTVQTSFADGTPEKDAINKSYSEAQRLMLIVSTCFYIVSFLSVYMWRDVDVKNTKKVKGLVA